MKSGRSQNTELGQTSIVCPSSVQWTATLWWHALVHGRHDVWVFCRKSNTSRDLVRILRNGLLFDSNNDFSVARQSTSCVQKPPNMEHLSHVFWFLLFFNKLELALVKRVQSLIIQNALSVWSLLVSEHARCEDESNHTENLHVLAIPARTKETTSQLLSRVNRQCQMASR